MSEWKKQKACGKRQALFSAYKSLNPFIHKRKHTGASQEEQNRVGASSNQYK